MLNRRNQYKALKKWFNRQINTTHIFARCWECKCEGVELTDEQKQAETLFIKMNKWRKEKNEL